MSDFNIEILKDGNNRVVVRFIVSGKTMTANVSKYDRHLIAREMLWAADKLVNSADGLMDVTEADTQKRNGKSLCVSCGTYMFPAYHHCPICRKRWR